VLRRNGGLGTGLGPNHPQRLSKHVRTRATGGPALGAAYTRQPGIANRRRVERSPGRKGTWGRSAVGGLILGTPTPECGNETPLFEAKVGAALYRPCQRADLVGLHGPRNLRENSYAIERAWRRKNGRRHVSRFAFPPRPGSEREENGRLSRLGDRLRLRSLDERDEGSGTPSIRAGRAPVMLRRRRACIRPPAGRCGLRPGGKEQIHSAR